MQTADDFLLGKPAAAPPPSNSADAFLGAAPKPALVKAAAPASPWSPNLIAQHAGPGKVTSGARTAAQNAKVGGSATSSHLDAHAYDWAPADGDTARAAKALAAAGIPYDQIIDEGTHVHVGYGPKMRGQTLTKGKGGFAQSAADFLAKAGAQFDTIRQDAGTRRRAAEGSFVEGFHEVADDFGKPYDPNVDPLTQLMGHVGGAAKMGGSAWSWLMSPVAGTLQATTGRPLEAATGGRLPASMMGDYTDTVTGFLMGGPKPKALAGDVAEFKPYKATKGEAATGVADDIVQAAPAGPAAPVAADFLKGGPSMAAKVEDPLDDILFAPKGRRTGTLTLPPDNPLLPKRGVKEGLSDAASAVQKLMAPATVGKGYDAAASIRHRSAEGDLMAAQSAQTLVEHARVVAKLPVEQQRALVGYIENRSTGGTLADPGLQKTADAIRKVNESYRTKIEDTLGVDEGPSFIRDYYTHLWKEAPQVVENAMVASRQGSGRNLKARSIPTLQEGIDAGLTPLTENPIEATMLYANNMSRYLSTVGVQEDLAGSDMTKWATQGQAPAGWSPLTGIRTEKLGQSIIKDGEAVAARLGQKLYAPDDVARVYNNWISNGFDRGDTAALFEPIRKASNGMVQLKLGLSAFHAVTMAQEAMISELSRGVTSLSRVPGLAAQGKLGEAGAELGRGALSAVKSPGQFIGYAGRGNRMQKELLGVRPPNDMSRAVNEAFIKAGGRIRMDPLYRTRGAGSFYNAVKDGTWKSELQATASKVFGKDRLMSERAMGIIDLGANLIQSTAAPLFEEYIPRVKQGAFASNMEDWMKANPVAKQAEIDTAAHMINRSIDNRFGEMAWDNLFWHRYLKQASQILLLSPTWNLGTINEIGGGLLDMLGPSARGLVSGKGVTPRTAYIAAGVAQVALMNGVLTYLKTGTAPEGMDFAAYRTGGTDATSGEPERAMTPGYQKDVYSFAQDFPNHIGQEVQNKLNPALKTALELSSNKDYRGMPIRPGEGAVTAEGDRGLGDYMLDQFMPISLGQLGKGEKIGSNLSTVERFLAIRPAPGYIQSPERVKRLTEAHNRRDWKTKRRADLRDKAMREP